jgi:8-oxo-dGTP diphosphatase
VPRESPARPAARGGIACRDARAAAEDEVLNRGAGALHVVAGVLRDGTGRVLLAQRPAGRAHAGLWELPGGKVEAGESPESALRRELGEELGVRPGGLRPLLRVPWRYPARAILLEVLEVDGFEGVPQGREGQALAWVAPDRLWEWPMPDADRPVAAALRLPRDYAITADPGDDAGALHADAVRRIGRGARLLQLRAPRLATPALIDVARRLGALAAEHGVQLLANAEPGAVAAVEGLGVHLGSARLAVLSERPLPAPRLVAASCHDAAELARAASLDCDFAVYGPLRATPTHPGVPGVGWERLAADCTECPLPLFALGGVGPEDLPRARAAGAFGVAGIRAFGG